MSDEWKVPGTESEENQQPVGEEAEVTEIKETESEETAEAESAEVMTETTEVQESEGSEPVEVTETTEEAVKNEDGQVVKKEEEKPRYPWETVLGKEERKVEEEKREQPAQHSDTQMENSQATGSYHWVNPDYQKRQNGTDSGECASQNTYENQNYREDVSGTADTQNYTETAARSQDNGGWGQIGRAHV